MSDSFTPTPVLIDTDCGVDDALALILALRSPELHVHAIVTVAGNVEVRQCTRNVLRVLSLLSPRTLPLVAQGSAKPIGRALVTAKEVHGKDGLGGLDAHHSVRGMSRIRRNGAAVIVDFCSTWKEQGTVIAVGPLTNIARAWKRNPSALKKVGRIISMGGAFRIPGNTGPVAEFNYFVDPEAAQAIITSGIPVDIVPLDITHQVTLLRSEVERHRSERPGPVSRFVSEVTRFYMEYHEVTEGFAGGYLHDPVAVAASVDPTIVEFVQASVAVETEGRFGRGMSVRFATGQACTGDGKRAKSGRVRIAHRIDRERFLNWFHERLWSS